jgi:hypothetical protein
MVCAFFHGQAKNKKNSFADKFDYSQIPKYYFKAFNPFGFFNITLKIKKHNWNQLTLPNPDDVNDKLVMLYS